MLANWIVKYSLYTESSEKIPRGYDLYGGLSKSQTISWE